MAAKAKIEVGKKVPPFRLPGTSEQEFDASTGGRKIVLYFYPRDNTPGCTLEGQDFAKLYKSFRSAGAEVFGISRDDLKSHHRFCEKFDFPFVLLSDTDEKVCRMFDVMKEKNMYGKKVQGIERSTFVLDEKGILLREWRKVSVEGHAQEVLDFIKSL